MRSGAATKSSRLESLRQLEHEIGVLRRRIKRVVSERAAAVHPELAPSSFWMLASIAESGPVRAAALVEEFHMDKGAVSRQLQHLAELGLVVREPDPADGRATLVSVSEDAKKRMKRVAETRRAWYAEQLSDWSADDLSTLVDLLSRYNASLER